MKIGFAPLIVAGLLSAAAVSSGADWITAPSYYTHDPASGERVRQYAPVGPIYISPRPDYLQSGYRHTQSSIQVGRSADHLHIVEEWGRPVRPYGEWQFPFRPYSVPYDLWGPPYPPYSYYGPWGAPSGYDSYGAAGGPYGAAGGPYGAAGDGPFGERPGFGAGGPPGGDGRYRERYGRPRRPYPGPDYGPPPSFGPPGSDGRPPDGAPPPGPRSSAAPIQPRAAPPGS
jgi:hypothetical protein